MKIIVSKMVCSRCVMVVESILDKLEYKNYQVAMGEIKLNDVYDQNKIQLLNQELEKVGFEILEDRVEQTISSIKSALITYLEHLRNGENQKMSTFITDHVFYDYSYLSGIFSKAENKTIEKYFIEMRIDKAKERLKYSQTDINTIANEMGYSTPQHFANQFKQYIGMTPSAFRKKYAVK